MGDIYVKIMTKYYNIKNLSFHFLPLLNSKFHEILLCVIGIADDSGSLAGGLYNKVHHFVVAVVVVFHG